METLPWPFLGNLASLLGISAVAAGVVGFLLPKQEFNKHSAITSLASAGTGVGTFLVLLVVVVTTGFVPFRVPNPTPSATPQLTATPTATPQPTATPHPASVYLLALVPSAGPQPHKGVVVINNSTYQNSIWFTVDQANGVGACAACAEIDSTWELSGSYHRFEAWLGLNAVAGSSAVMQYEVWLDSSRVQVRQVNGAQDPYHVLVDTSGAQ
jgi:hypothetical protein